MLRFDCLYQLQTLEHMFRVLLKMSVDELHSPLKLMDMPDKSEKKMLL